jgi:hypothetical protein
MTISSVALTQEGTALAATGTDGEQVKRIYTAHYRVITDNSTTSTKSIEKHFKTTTTLPWFGRSWKWTGENGAANDNDTEAICKKIEVSHQPGSSGIFKVEATFEPRDSDKQKEKPDDGDGDDTTDPLEWRQEMSISYSQITVPVMWAIFHGFTTGDRADVLIEGRRALQRGLTYIPQNSALVPYDPLPEMEIDLKVIRMVRNIPKFQSWDYDPWISSVNTDPVHIIKQHLGMWVSIEPYQGRIKGVSGSTAIENGKPFVRREVEIWVNPNGWRGRLADIGHAVQPEAEDTGFVSPGDLINKPAQAEQVTVRDVNEYPMTAPIKLDGFGRALRTADPHVSVWTNWQYYDERQWTGTVDLW